MTFNVRNGRKATKHVRTLFDRFWLFATDWRIVIYVGLTPSSGKSTSRRSDLLGRAS